MKSSWIPAAAMLATMLVVSPRSSADDSVAAQAILRCDPGVVIQSIDGHEELHAAGNGQLFVECAVPLAPGSHEIEACHEIHTGRLVAKCQENSHFRVDAKAGGAYRVRLQLELKPDLEWKSWVEDVTDSESGFSFEKPARKPKPSGSKKDLETVVVMGATPEYAWLFLEKGQLLGKWFTHGSLFGPMRSKGQSTAGVPGGYHIIKVKAGDTIALTGGRMMEGSMFVAKGVHPCGDFPLRVYEDLPGGKVLYLGHLNLRTALLGYVGEYTDNLEAARSFLEQSEPELAKRLEPASFRVLSVADVCYGLGEDMVASRR
jgi:hypothetical protein